MVHLAQVDRAEEEITGHRLVAPLVQPERLVKDLLVALD
jgi:hypothetical protein